MSIGGVRGQRQIPQTVNVRARIQVAFDDPRNRTANPFEGLSLSRPQKNAHGLAAGQKMYDLSMGGDPVFQVIIGSKSTLICKPNMEPRPLKPNEKVAFRKMLADQENGSVLGALKNAKMATTLNRPDQHLNKQIPLKDGTRVVGYVMWQHGDKMLLRRPDEQNFHQATAKEVRAFAGVWNRHKVHD